MYALLIIAGLLWLTGCKPESAVPQTNSTNQVYSTRGVVQEIATDRKSATIKHEKIPGYMAAMTMDLSVKDTNALSGISAGDEVTFDLVVTADDDWIENVRVVGKTNVNVIPGWQAVEPELNPGDLLPDYEFTGEDGGVFRFTDFRGKAVAFTFFFISCPLPEFCPRMNKNFAEARKILRAMNVPKNWELLSISFDPDFDKPEILASHGKFFRGEDPSQWRFAVASTNTLASLAPKVDLHFRREGGSISHNLRTVVLDTEGKIFKQFDGNDWTAQDLAVAIAEAARKK